MFEQKFAFSLVVFCSHAPISIWLLLFFLIFWIGFFNSRTATAGAIIGLLLVFFLYRRHDFCYDHMTSQPLFVHSFRQFQLNCMCDVIFRSQWSEFFCSCAWLNFWSHLTYSLSKMTFSLWNWLLFTLFQRDKVKWVCVTLTEGYLRAANRGSKNLYRFLIKI